MLRRKLIRRRAVRRLFLLVLPAVAFSFNVGFAKPVQQDSLFSFPVHDTMQARPSDSLLIKSAVPCIALNRNVVRFVKTYLVKEDEYLQLMKVKSRPLFGTIETVFSAYHLPTQLKYLAIVESGLQRKVQSKAGARGLWQLMPVTAKELGLKMNGKTDERLHTYRSTVAAAKYLQSLYAAFNDWLLALAAYNCGPGAVYAAIKKGGTRNYWALQRFLPAESRGHVKRFIGVHYFFEGEGSIATQTGAEARAWQEAWCVDTGSR